jgi:hypothetical protein
MDTAVAFVEAYLRINGYFTIAEYPVLEELRGEQYRTLTDIDILAFRFPSPAPMQSGKATRTADPEWHRPDTLLGFHEGVTDMIIGEVKEGAGELNPGSRNPLVLRATLMRFGCCNSGEVDHVVEELLRDGSSMTQSGHRVRLLVFGSTPSRTGGDGFVFIPLGHLVRYLESHIDAHWERMRQSQIKHPALAFLMTLEKARRGLPAHEDQR